MLAALGIGVTAGTELDAQRRTSSLSATDIRGALAIQGRAMTEGEVTLVQRALQRNLDEFQRVRDLELGDHVGLPVVFRARRA
jgi:hypothetical protein